MRRVMRCAVVLTVFVVALPTVGHATHESQIWARFGSYLEAGDSNDGTFTRLDSPDGVAVDHSGVLYIADGDNDRILRFGDDGMIWPYVGTGSRGFSGDGGQALEADLFRPAGVATDAEGNLYFADSGNHRVRRVDAVTGIISTVAGTGAEGSDGDGGLAVDAEVHGPFGVAVGPDGTLFIAESQSHRVRAVDPDTGIITTVAGTGEAGFNGDGIPAIDAELHHPGHIAVDGQGNLFVSDSANHRVRMVGATTGTITTVAGTGEAGFNGDGIPATDAELTQPSGLAIDDVGNLWVAEGMRIRLVDQATGIISTIAGGGAGDVTFQGPAVDAALLMPSGLAIHPGGVYASDLFAEVVWLISDVVHHPPDPDPVAPPTVGLVDPTQGIWHLRNSDGVVTSFYFGNPGDVPFVGDWNCDGIQTPGLYRQSDGFVYLRNTNTQGIADITFFFGNPGDVPIAGDFNGDGCDTVSIYRPGNQTFYIINELGQDGGGLGAAQFSYVFGNPGDKPFTGDFNGNGLTTVGLHRESTGLVYFRNTHTQGNAHAQFFFGDPGDRFVAGDWNADGIDSPAVFRPGNATFFFRFTNTQGNADAEFVWGSPGWLPIAGTWGLG